MKKIIFIVLLSLCSIASQAQDDALKSHIWKASWIALPDADATGYGVYEFQKEISLTAVPEHFIVHVTADNRYKLHVNDRLVSVGPARSDLRHWNYETVDLAPYLTIGSNKVRALVWNEGAERAEANNSVRTGFLLQGDDEASVLNTDGSWQGRKDLRYSPRKFELTRHAYMVTGPGEYVDMNQAADEWRPTKAISQAMPREAIGGLWSTGICADWLLQPSIISQRELKEEHTLGFKPVTIPAHSEKTILLDNGVLTNAYMNMRFGKGKDSHITLSYQESLVTKYPHKGNRNETAGKVMLGREDEIVSNGDEQQLFTSLAFRTYRFVQLTIKTAEEPLTIADVYGTATSYPFQLKASLDTDSQELQDFLTIGWRTAKLCAWETYTDCPYYEQLQYLGDTRIQMLVTLYNVGDDPFIRNYLNLADWSRAVEGVTQSRYPARTPQYIAPYALHYIYSLHDYMMYANEPDFIREKLVGLRAILDYFHHYQLADGRLKNVPGWNFTDWVEQEGWNTGVSLPGADGGSSVLDLQLLYAYQLAAHLERELGMQEQAAIYEERASTFAHAIEKAYWDVSKGLYADRIEKDTYSQHANALAILTGVATGDKAHRIAKVLEQDSTLAPASIYFKFYVHQALTKAGLGDNYLSWLDKWRENMRLGLTTWAEISDVENARSDCHAWGASPNIEFYRTILGIDSDAPAFSRVCITPHLGDIQQIGGRMPHPNGLIEVSYQKQKKGLKAVVSLPDNTTGTFVWEGNTYELHAGRNEINAKAKWRYREVLPHAKP